MWAELSAHKRFLFGVGLATIIGLSACVFLSAALLHGLRIRFWVESLAITLFVVALIGCVPVMTLLNEYTRLVRENQNIWQRFWGLRWIEIQALTAGCPAGINAAALGVGLLALFQCLRLGHFAVTVPGIAWADVTGILAGASFFFSLCVPFLLSAAFTRGSYAEQLRRQRRGPTTRAR